MTRSQVVVIAPVGSMSAVPSPPAAETTNRYSLPSIADIVADPHYAAREMIRMVRTINADFVSKVAEGDATATVRCETCHRGRAHPPKPLADLLADTAATQGADAAVAKYTEMRSESLESGQYDFRARSVVNAARRLQDEKHAEAATSLLKGAVALFPNSADVAATLGMALLQGGDRDGAKAQFDRALAIDPNNGQAQQGLRRLQGGQGGRP